MLPIALTLILGLGACDSSGDWCVDKPATLAFEQTIIQKDEHSFTFSAEHFSRIGNGELKGRGDYGINIFMFEYRYNFGLDALFGE